MNEANQIRDLLKIKPGVYPIKGRIRTDLIANLVNKFNQFYCKKFNGVTVPPLRKRSPGYVTVALESNGATSFMFLNGLTQHDPLSGITAFSLNFKAGEVDMFMQAFFSRFTMSWAKCSYYEYPKKNREDARRCVDFLHQGLKEYFK